MNLQTLFVGQLSKSTQEIDLDHMFSKHGTIDHVTILKDKTGRSKCCGFVRFKSSEHAKEAIKNMHGSQTMKVD